MASLTIGLSLIHGLPGLILGWCLLSPVLLFVLVIHNKGELPLAGEIAIIALTLAVLISVILSYSLPGLVVGLSLSLIVKTTTALATVVMMLSCVPRHFQLKKLYCLLTLPLLSTNRYRNLMTSLERLEVNRLSTNWEFRLPVIKNAMLIPAKYRDRFIELVCNFLHQDVEFGGKKMCRFQTEELLARLAPVKVEDLEQFLNHLTRLGIKYTDYSSIYLKHTDLDSIWLTVS